MLLNKKADFVYQTIFGLIFLLLVLILLYNFLQERFLPAQEEFFNSEACRLSVLKASLPGQGVRSLNELSGCKTHELTIEEIDEDLIQELLINNIDLCLYMFGNGKINFLSETEIINNLCFICSKMTFENDITLDSDMLIKNEAYKENFKDKPVLTVFDKIKENTKLYFVIVTSTEPKSIIETLNLWPVFFEKVIGMPFNPLIVPTTIEKALNRFGYGVYFPKFNSHFILTDTSKLLKNCNTIA